VTGLPDHTNWQLIQVDYRINAERTTQVTYNLVVNVEPQATTGLYLFAVNVSAATTGGTISHSVSSIQIDIET
jgi:hypothetical protein